MNCTELKVQIPCVNLLINMNPTILFIFLLLFAGSAYLPHLTEKAIRQIGLAGAVFCSLFGFLIAISGFTNEPQFWSSLLWYQDSLTAFFVVLICFLYLSASFVSYRYIGHEYAHQTIQLKHVRLYHLSLPLFILTMLLAVFANNIGVLWVALEATTLTTTFLVAFYTTDSSIEAAWKYIMICSTGIALGLLGILMIAYAGTVAGTMSSLEAFQFHQLRAQAQSLLPEMMRWAFVFIFVGIGTKVGFVPMHTWLPDAHSKTPSPISGILSGILLNIALYTILRFKLLTDLSLEQTWWTNRFFLTFGMLSIVVSAFLIYIQRNYKRMLAYSSIEHMGLTAFAVGLGPFGLVPALMHIAGHAVAKSMLFFGAGEILLRYKTTKIIQIRRLFLQSRPTAILFFLGLLGLLGIPPSALFVSEFLMIGYGMQTQVILTLIVLCVLTMICVSMIRHTLTMFFDHDSPHQEHVENLPQEPWTITHFVMGCHLFFLMVLGVYFLTDSGMSFISQIAEIISPLL